MFKRSFYLVASTHPLTVAEVLKLELADSRERWNHVMALGRVGQMTIGGMMSGILIAGEVFSAVVVSETDT